MRLLRRNHWLDPALPCLAGAALLASCAAQQPRASATTNAGPRSPRWTQDTLIQPDQLLPNGLRPLRYFDW